MDLAGAGSPQTSRVLERVLQVRGWVPGGWVGGGGAASELSLAHGHGAGPERMRHVRLWSPPKMWNIRPPPPSWSPPPSPPKQDRGFPSIVRDGGAPSSGA